MGDLGISNMSRTVIIVLAFDHTEYREMARDLREERDEQIASVFANSVDRLRGIEADEIVKSDLFWERNDAIDIAKTAQNHLK